MTGTRPPGRDRHPRGRGDDPAVGKTRAAAAGREVAASVVVFLVALPLCVGVATASGVPAELGLVTGIVGGLVVGCLPGSSLQVSGPAAGLTVLVHEAVSAYGITALGVIVLAAGVLQLAMGLARIGGWFRAVSVSVVQGMLAGIGLVLIAGQLYAMADATAPSTGPAKIIGLPGLLAGAVGSFEAQAALALGATTIAVMTVWRHLPHAVRRVPSPLAGVGLATGLAVLSDAPVAKVEVQGVFEAIQPPTADALGQLAAVSTVGTVLAFALIASAESLFGAAAVDRLHDGPRTDYDKELIAQGVGNTVCGMLGALPLTAVIVRSAANVQAGAHTKASRVLHGVWLLLFAAILPSALSAVPLASLAGVLIYSGGKLIPVREWGGLWREQRGEAVILVATAASIVVVNMFEGVLIGLAFAVAKTAWDTSHLRLEVSDQGNGPVKVYMIGNATFLRLPKMLDALEALPRNRSVEIDLTGLRHLDHACRTALSTWAEPRNEGRTQPVTVIDAS
ncbi:sulfate transporter [Streptomyces atratus]|uniref:Sulfate transporter n=1 Tax=Streptomyces atratus TaxID=1893 RepID=A0A2Z5JLH2_STRAR|nr:sulfate transporter [Streptomyces atratus]